MASSDTLLNGSWFKLITTQGVPAALLVVLVLWGATVFAKDLSEVKAVVEANRAAIADMNRHLEILVKIGRQSCVNTAAGDRLAIAGCMVNE